MQDVSFSVVEDRPFKLIDPELGICAGVETRTVTVTYLVYGDATQGDTAWVRYKAQVGGNDLVDQTSYYFSPSDFEGDTMREKGAAALRAWIEAGRPVGPPAVADPAPEAP